MAEESNRNILFGLLQTSIEISLGAAHKSLEMARNPQESASKVVTEVKSMLTVPAHAGPEFQNQAQAMVGVWL